MLDLVLMNYEMSKFKKFISKNPFVLFLFMSSMLSWFELIQL